MLVNLGNPGVWNWVPPTPDGRGSSQGSLPRWPRKRFWMNRPAWLTLAPTSGRAGLHHSWSSVSCGFLGTHCPKSSAPAAATGCVHTPPCVILTAARYGAGSSSQFQRLSRPPPRRPPPLTFPWASEVYQGSKIPCLEVSRAGLHALVFYTNNSWHRNSTALAMLIWRGDQTNTKTWAIHIPWIGSEEERNKYILWKNSQEEILTLIFKETGASDWLDQIPAVVSPSLKMFPTLSSSLPGTTFLFFGEL